MYTSEVIQLATRYTSPGRLVGKKSKVYGQGQRQVTGMQIRKIFG